MQRVSPIKTLHCIPDDKWAWNDSSKSTQRLFVEIFLGTGTWRDRVRIFRHRPPSRHMSKHNGGHSALSPEAHFSLNADCLLDPGIGVAWHGLAWSSPCQRLRDDSVRLRRSSIQETAVMPTYVLGYSVALVGVDLDLTSWEVLTRFDEIV
jgi:hypothetical protein